MTQGLTQIGLVGLATTFFDHGAQQILTEAQS